jgi:uncharacterized protein YegL
MAPILFINVALSIVFAEGFLRGTHTNNGHPNILDIQVGAKSSLEKFLADVSPRIDALLNEGLDAKEGLTGIISHGAATIDPSQAASDLLFNTKAFPQGPPEELRDVLHHLVKRHDGKSKTRLAKTSLVHKNLAQNSQPATTSEYISGEDMPKLDVSEDAVKKAVKKCNDMVEEARTRLDNKCMECMAECNKTSKAMIALSLDLDRLFEEYTELQGTAIRVKSAKERAEEELEDIVATNLTISTDYFNGLAADTKEMNRIKDELAVTKFMVKLTRCPESELPSGSSSEESEGLLQQNMTRAVNVKSCRTNGSTELTFVDARLENAKKSLSLQARELLTMSLFRAQSSYGGGAEKLDDGDDNDDEVDESGWEYVEQDQGIGMIQTKDKDHKHQQQPCPIGHLCGGGALPCDIIPADCGQLHDTFASIWGEIKDEYEVLQDEMAEKKAEYEKQRDYHNREADILSLQVSSLDEKFLQAEEQKISISTKRHILAGELSSKQTYHKEYGLKCKDELEQIAGTEVCGPMAVRNELLENVLELKKEEIGDCVTTDWVSGDCSVKCDDSLVGGFKPLMRQVIEVNSTVYGLPCPSLSLNQKCGQFKCPVDCELEEWSDWAECTRECGGGAQTRSRNIKTKPVFGGKGCDPLTDAQPCNTQSCDKDCGLLDWTDWNPCSSACGGGAQARFRDEDIQKPAEGLNGKCPDYYDAKRYKNQTCNEAPCQGDEVCIAAMDVVLLIDGSGSLSEKGFGILKKLSLQILERLNATAYGNEAVRVGVVQFGNGHLEDDDTVSSAKLVQSFKTDTEATKTAIEGMKYQKGFTNMAQGLMKAKDLLEKTGRAKAAQTVVMITDGYPSFEYSTAQAAQRVRKSGNLVVVHVKNRPRPLDVALMMKFARYTGNYLNIPGKKALKEDMQTYASHAVVQMCPEAESLKLVAEKNAVRGFQKLKAGWWCSNPSPPQSRWFSGHEGAGWSDEMSKETCGAKAEEISPDWTFFEYTFYPGSTFHECLVYLDPCDKWSRWTHANIYEEYVKPAVINKDSMFEAIGPDASVR